MNFNELLFQELSVDNNSEDNKCLISGEDLDKYTSVTLPCSHKFNYKYIFNEVYKQVYSYNMYDAFKINKGTMRCPYCRVVHNCILPFMTVEDQEGKNLRKKYVNQPITAGIYNNKCVYTNKKGIKCDLACHNEYCNKHIKLIMKNENALNLDLNLNLNSNKGSNTCMYIYKKGKNKGLLCGSKCKGENTLCKKHS
jgi:hypothetical protein